MPAPLARYLPQVKKTCYAQTSQIRLIRKKMVEIMTREASACDLKELVGKFIPESIGASHTYQLPLSGGLHGPSPWRPGFVRQNGHPACAPAAMTVGGAVSLMLMVSCCHFPAIVCC